MNTNIEKLKERLKRRYLGIGEYFNEAFEFGKVMLKEEKKWMIGLLIIIFLKDYIIRGIIENVSMETMFMSVQNVSIILITTFIINFVQIVFFKKIVDKIAGKTHISNMRVFFKYLFFAILYVFFIVLLVFLSYIINTFTPLGSVFTVIVIIFLFISIFFLLYFTQIYFTKDIDLLGAFEYNLHLSKGNRLRVILTSLICALIYLIISMVLGSVIGIFSFVPNISALVQSVNMVSSSVLETLMALLSNSVAAIVYLNVEYIDLKKSKTSNNIENTNKIDDFILEENNEISDDGE